MHNLQAEEEGGSVSCGGVIRSMIKGSGLFW